MTSDLPSDVKRRNEPNHLAAVGYMLGAVFFFSFVPLVISKVGGPESPFLFNLGWRLGAALGCLVALFIFYRPVFLEKCARKLIIRRALGWLMLGAIYNSFDYALFAWSIKLIDISVATVIYEIWPIGFILLMGWLFRREGIYRKNIPALFPLLALALAGFAFVVASQSEEPSAVAFLTTDTMKGVILVLLAMVGGSLAACSFRWGRLLADELPDNGVKGFSTDSLHFFGTVLGFTISSLVGVILSGGIGIVRGERIGFEDFSVILFGGALFLTSGIMLLRRSNLATDNLGVNALSYMTPLVALSWLLIFAEITVARGSFLVIGTIAIIIANLLINFQAEIRFGFQALVLGLGISGTIVYLRDGIFEYVGIQESSTDNLGVNALSYMTPLVALSWLLIFAEITVARGSFLVIGTIAIIIANLLINFQAEIRFGFQALVLGLGISGTIVYLRDGIFEYVGIQEWHWTASGYFEATALAATVFTLLLAFRVARLVTRTSSEETRIFGVFRRLEFLARKGVVNKNICNCVLKMDSSTKDRELMEAYKQARRYIERSRPVNATDLEILNQSEADLDSLARSKQTGLVLGELFALFVFAGITIVLALSSRPPGIEGWTRFLVDLFAMLISGIIIFLLSNVWDLHKERGESKLESESFGHRYVVGFRDTERRLPDQWVSVIVGVSIVIAFAGLLLQKWLG